MRAIQTALTALVLCVLFAPEASAQIVADLPASTGTVMAAAMETSGYKAQEVILSQMHDMLGNLASLIYIVCAVVGIFSVVFTGGYRLGLWLLVAPHLFYWTIDNRTLASGVDWQFGAYQNNNGAVEEVLGYTAPSQGESNVSWLFHQYNRLVSSIIQETIKVVTDDQTKRQMKFMTRQHIMDDLFAAEPTDPGLWGLVKWSTAVCSQELQDARMLALGERDSSYKFTPEWDAANDRLNGTNSVHRLDTKNKPLYTTSGSLAYAKELLDSFASKSDGELDAYTRHRGSECLRDATGYRYATIRNSSRLDDEGVSCSQLWCWMHHGLKEEAANALARSMDKHLQDDTTNDTYSEILQEIATKLHVCQPSSNPDDDPDGCARDEEGKPFQTVQPDESVIPTIMAGYLLRKIMTSDRRSDMMTTFGQHAGISGKAFNFNSKMDANQRQEVGQRMRQHQMAMTERARVYSLAMTIPYIQGVLLYGLAMLFPFFA
ncbi:MAG: hypothetical protein KDD66_06765, partial [Bdellovibrionales bacterium]|nr:hypothetical protein [Bdellovibrionales bacterium]